MLHPLTFVSLQCLKHELCFGSFDFSFGHGEAQTFPLMLNNENRFPAFQIVAFEVRSKQTVVFATYAE